ncbi:diguanylate cyclase [Alloyangia pacifica]|uniref:Diguanylate cyclase n=1 Tax=Alloyangia pacifica TaxID=311180 RepID=A0A2U8HJD0_9RHOB|nr:PAS domain-containing protein [Alloyangia pacifica]AWI85126.1 diguanylate cyclase [Alloyangia pacifica]
MTAQDSLPKPLGDYMRSARVALAVSRIGEDAPLVLVNEAFCTLTGYSADEVIGHNCRFLQGADTTEEMRRPLREFVRGTEPHSGRFPILNYRKDGTSFFNFVFMTRLLDRDESPRFLLASQFDMTTAMRRNKLPQNDMELTRALDDLEQISREFGLAIIGSAQMISESVALLARLSLDTDED